MIALKRLSALTLLLTLTACSAFSPRTQSLAISANVPDVKAVVNGQSYMLPALVELPKNENVNINAYKKGYEPAVYSIRPTISTTGVLDIAGGFLCLVPFIGIATPGAWELYPSNIHLNLVEK